LPVAGCVAGVAIVGKPHSGRHRPQHGFEFGGSGAQRLHHLPPEARHLKIGADARQQFARGKRLGEIVVGDGVDPFDPRFLAGASGEEQQRYIARNRIGAQCAQQTKPVEQRHHDVRQNEIGHPAPYRRQGRFAVGNGLDLDLVALIGQQAANVVAHIGVVVGQQDFAAGRSPGRNIEIVQR
jgi:hypothetical protein